MDSARDAVLQLQVHLGDSVLGEDRGIGDITCVDKLAMPISTEAALRIYILETGSHTDGSRLNHVADGEALDRLILGSASRAVAAADGLGVAAALLVAAAVSC